MPRSIYDRITTPLTTLPSDAAKRLSDKISPMNEEGSPLRGFASGAVEGAGDYLSGMTSPLSLAGIAAGYAPWLKGAQGLTSLGRINEFIPKGISPSILPPSLVGSGGEGAYNAARNIPQGVKTLEDLAYEVVRNPNKIRSSIGGDFNVADLMSRVTQARGK